MPSSPKSRDKQEALTTAPTISLGVGEVDTSRADFLASPGKLASPTTIGRFEIRSILGQGAFGSVYLARDPQLERQVAVKVPRDGVLKTAEDMQRFLREARAAATLNHPQVCPVFEVGEVEGHPYIVMAYIEGKTLGEVLQGKPTSDRQAATAIRKIALALDEAHRKQIVHRDLKPGNIMINRRGEPVVMDFGLARLSEPGDVQLTMSGVIMGTPAYMSPEQARGDGKVLGPATDIFSLGVILYEMLAGRRPFQGTLTEVLASILHIEPPPPTEFRNDIDPRLAAICMKAMAKRPKERYASMAAFAAALADFLREATGKSADSPSLPPMLPPSLPPLSSYAVSPGRYPSTVNAQATPAPTVVSPAAAQLPTIVTGTAGTQVVALTSPRYASKSLRRQKFPAWLPMAFAAFLGASLLLLGIIFFARTPTATVLINVDVDWKDPALRFTLDKELMAARQLATPIELAVGSHELIIQRGDKFERRFTFEVRGGDQTQIAVIEDSGPQKGVAKASASPSSATSITGASLATAAAAKSPPGDGWVDLFNGKDLSGWKSVKGGPATWKVLNGYMEIDGPNIVTERLFGPDFEFQTEFWIAKSSGQGQRRGNSGIYLLGRHEIQIMDGYQNPDDPKVSCGALFSLVGVSQNVCKPPEEWQSFAVDFHGPRKSSWGSLGKGRLTVVHNGTKVIDNVEFAAIPGDLSYDTKLGEPGPIMLQSYGHRVRFRNIRIKEKLLANGSVPTDAKYFAGHAYKFFPEKLTWKEAKAACDKLGGHLVVFESMEENQFVGGMIDAAGWLDSWIGITDEAQEDKWLTVSGKPVNFTNWFTNQPNNKNKDEHYALMTIRTFAEKANWRWCDQPNESQTVHHPGYVCEWDLTGK